VALVLADRIKETTATTGTGTLTLIGPEDGFQSFASVGDGNTTYYAVQHATLNEFEVGVGTYTSSGTTLSRDTVYTSSNSNAAVDFSAGTKIVFVVVPTEATVYEDTSNNITVGGKITVASGPTAQLDVATKAYVDAATAASIHIHDAVRVEREGTLNATYNNGTAGVGATLTNAGTQAALVIDGITLNTNDRVLIYEQTDATENGVYVVTDTGSVSTNWVLTRSADANTSGDNDANSLDEGSYFYVQEGTAGAGESYVCNVSGAITFGTTDITFAQFAATPEFTGGTNIDITGQTISLTGTVDETNGGTGNNTYTTGDTLYASATNTLAKLSGNTTTTKKYFSQTGTGSASQAPAWDEINLGTDTAGDYVASFTAGTGITGDASGEGSAPTIALDLNELSTSVTSANGDYFAVVDSADGAQYKLTKANIDISGFNNDSGFITSADGGNAATLDSLDSTSFLRSDAADTKTAGDLSFSDNVKAIFGAGSDLQIYHDGSNSYISEQGSGNLFIQGDSGIVIESASTGENFIAASSNGAVTLFYDNSAKLATTSTGVAVTGGFTATAPSTISSESGYAALEMGGASGAYIDMKSPASDDYDGRIQWNGSDLILTTSATSGGDVVLQHQGNNTKLRTTATGVDVTGDVTSSSDEALKENIQLIENALSKVQQINGVSFNWKDSGNSSIGVIAQNVETVIPEAVSKNTDGVRSVAYGNMVGLLIEAVKEQQESIEELKARVAELEG
jgi:hypothetical protein